MAADREFQIYPTALAKWSGKEKRQSLVLSIHCYSLQLYSLDVNEFFFERDCQQCHSSLVLVCADACCACLLLPSHSSNSLLFYFAFVSLVLQIHDSLIFFLTLTGQVPGLREEHRGDQVWDGHGRLLGLFLANPGRIRGWKLQAKGR